MDRRSRKSVLAEERGGGEAQVSAVKLETPARKGWRVRSTEAAESL
jgi:hypothetical protein